MKIENGNLTLLITIHSDLKSVDYYLDILKYSKNNVIFCFDNPTISSEIKNKITNSNFDFFINEINTGKLKLILNSLHKVKTEYLKIIDQDDSISIQHLEIFNKEIIKLKGEMLIKHKAFKIDSNSKWFDRQFSQEKILLQINDSYDVKYNQQTNCDTIYHTETLKKMINPSLKLGRQNFHNDVLISNFSIGLGLKLTEIDMGFYIQFHEKGQTSDKKNVDRANCILELYENYLKIKNVYNNFDLKLTLNSDFNAHKRFIKRFTIDYLKDINEKKGDELFSKTMIILENLWKTEQ